MYSAGTSKQSQGGSWNKSVLLVPPDVAIGVRATSYPDHTVPSLYLISSNQAMYLIARSSSRPAVPFLRAFTCPAIGRPSEADNTRTTNTSEWYLLCCIGHVLHLLLTLQIDINVQ